MNKQLTDRHITLYKCIKKFINEKGYSPSYRELQKLTNIKSLSVINRDLKDLKDMEYIDHTEGVSRSLRVL